MELIDAVILGAIQGVTEFLPVSSSGHLALAHRLLGLREPSLFFDTMLHLGTLAAVFAALRRDILGLLRRPFRRLTGLLVVATVPTVVIALLFKDMIEAAFASGATLGWEFLATGAVLLWADRAAAPGGEKDESTMSWFDAAFIGVLQGVAIMPAVSRSGLTVAGALVRKLDRGFAARFSFLLSIPAILGAVVLQGKDMLEGADVGTIGLPVVIGTTVAAAVGLLSVNFMLKIVRKGSLAGFSAYVFILGTLVLLDQYVFGVFF